jgi:hypothetical protein
MRAILVAERTGNSFNHCLTAKHTMIYGCIALLRQLKVIFFPIFTEGILP